MSLVEQYNAACLNQHTNGNLTCGSLEDTTAFEDMEVGLADCQHLSLIGVGRGLILHHMAVVMSLCGRACVPRGSWPPWQVEAEAVEWVSEPLPALPAARSVLQ